MIILTSILFFFSSLGTDLDRPVTELNITAPAIRKTVNRELLVRLVNDIRRKGVQCGSIYYPPVPPVRWNELLEKAAIVHSTDMYKKKYFSHVASDGSRAGERLDRIGYPWMAYGENIGMGYTTEEEVVEAWVKSPGHCKNIMNRNYKEMGLARVGHYWTQTFGTR